MRLEKGERFIIISAETDVDDIVMKFLGNYPEFFDKLVSLITYEVVLKEQRVS